MSTTAAQTLSKSITASSLRDGGVPADCATVQRWPTYGNRLRMIVPRWGSAGQFSRVISTDGAV
jgi:hypothetical protein